MDNNYEKSRLAYLRHTESYVHTATEYLKRLMKRFPEHVVEMEYEDGIVLMSGTIYGLLYHEDTDIIAVLLGEAWFNINILTPQELMTVVESVENLANSVE